MYLIERSIGACLVAFSAFLHTPRPFVNREQRCKARLYGTQGGHKKMELDGPSRLRKILGRVKQRKEEGVSEGGSECEKRERA
jgi:hypothetical protein